MSIADDLNKALDSLEGLVNDLKILGLVDESERTEAAVSEIGDTFVDRYGLDYVKQKIYDFMPFLIGFLVLGILTAATKKRS